MDDDDLRRGRPTCHKAYDEGTAVLAGDALQALAFEVLRWRRRRPPSPAARLQQVQVLARGIGTAGMAGGQAIDLDAVGQQLDAAALEAMHRRKTGALIQASVLLGAIAAGIASRRGSTKRWRATVRNWAWPSRSRTMCSMWRAKPRRWARPPAPMPRAASPPTPACLGLERLGAPGAAASRPRPWQRSRGLGVARAP